MCNLLNHKQPLFKIPLLMNGRSRILGCQNFHEVNQYLNSRQETIWVNPKCPLTITFWFTWGISGLEKSHICIQMALFQLTKLKNLLTYMGVFGLVQTKVFCLDGVSVHYIFVSPLLLLLRGKVITSSFYIRVFPFE